MDGEAQEAEAPPAPPARKQRAPLDPEARAKVAERSKVRRLLAKVGESKDESELFAKIDELRGKKPASAPAAGVVVEPKKVEPWEDEAVLAEARPGIAAVTAGVLMLLPEKYRPQPVVIGKDKDGADVVLAPEQKVAAGVAPWVVQAGAQAVTTPKATALLTVGLVFVPPTLAMLWGEVIAPWWAARRERKKAAAVAAAPAEVK